MASNVKILLVDDNPMVLGMLQQALSAMGEVTVATDAADALLKAVDDLPDVLISDYRMPGMDGRQDPIEDYLEKPFFLKDATHKIKRVVDRIALEKLSKAASTDGVLRGSLSQMNVIDLVQSLEMGRKSCLLTMTNGDDKCEIYFSQGQAKHAAYGPITGDEAVFKVLRWTEGNFQIDFNGKSSQETTTLNTQGLLMEGLRLLDEAQRDAAAEGEDVLLDT